MYLAPPIYLVRDKEGRWLDSLFHSEAEAEKAAEAVGLDPKKSVDVYPGPKGRFPTPMQPAWLAEMVRLRCLLPKSELKDGAWYIGECRNSNLAQWDAARNVFVHWREKFESRNGVYVERGQAFEDHCKFAGLAREFW